VRDDGDIAYGAVHRKGLAVGHEKAAKGSRYRGLPRDFKGDISH
jgi:hypothetical protein